MVHHKSQKASESEKQIQTALARITNSIYRSVDQAVDKLGVSKTTLHPWLKEGKSKTKVHEPQQHLTKEEEQVLAQWISTSTATGNPVQHSLIYEMAEKLRQACLTTQFIFVPPRGKPGFRSSWAVTPTLKTKLLHAIKASYIKEVSH